MFREAEILYSNGANKRPHFLVNTDRRVTLCLGKEFDDAVADIYKKLEDTGGGNIDLSEYLTKVQIQELIDGLNAIINNKQNALTAGINIKIDGNEISATDTVYNDTEVRNLITGLESSKANVTDVPTLSTVSQMLAEKQNVLSPGDNIQIVDNRISAVIPDTTPYDDTVLKNLISGLQDEIDSLKSRIDDLENPE